MARAARRSRQRQLEKQRKRAARHGRRAGVAAGTALGAALLLAPSAQAADIEVNTLADGPVDGCGVGTCTLRDAVSDAVANGEDDLITFQSSLTGTITLTEGEIPITNHANSIEIRETGPDLVSVSGDDASRIFNITSDNGVVLDGLTLTNGSTPFDGGAIYTDADEVTIANSIVTNSYAGDDGGGIGIDNSSDVTISDSTVSSNASDSDGGGISVFDGSRLTVSDSEISGNVAGSSGGGIASKYATTVVNNSSEVSGNDAVVAGGGIANTFGSLTVDQSAITGNGLDTPEVGGGIANTKYGSATITNSTITGNRADAAGGGFFHVGGDPTETSPFQTSTLIQNTTIDGNSAGYSGGGILAGPGKYGDSFLINQSTISNNTLTEEGSTGGGVTFTGTGGTAELRSSTVSGNTAGFGGGVSSGYPYGPGPVRAQASRSEARDAGIARNSEPPMTERQREQRVAAEAGGAVPLNNSTIADNAASEEGGGIFNGIKYSPEEEVDRDMQVSSTIVGDNTAGGAPNDLATSEDAGVFELNYALVETPGSADVTQNPAGQSILGEDPQLAGLGDNGGPTETQSPATSSPAIDTGIDNTFGRDQRGELRRVQLAAPNNPADDPTDIGAVELQGPLPPAGTRDLSADEVPGDCPVPFADADTALAGDNQGQTIPGSSGRDILRGFGGADSVIGEASGDCLTGDGGSDAIRGMGGADWATGGGGRDDMKANAGDDDFSGGGDFDRLRMAAGADTAHGGADHDNIKGGDGPDKLFGDGGPDRIFGNNGDDNLKGNAGNDAIFVGRGKNTVNCGPGNDKVVVHKRGKDNIKNCERILLRRDKVK